jgi:bifunctional NMN adenylyltransferase/nudix hydrolase
VAHQDVTVYIGRFSPFHLGHAHVLEQALKTSKLVIVLVGSSFQARSIKNPFSFDERKNMIEAWHLQSDQYTYGSATLLILPLRDRPYNNTMWIESVQEAVKQAMALYCESRACELNDVALTGSDRDDSTWYLASFPQWKTNLLPEYSRPDDLKVSATSVREIMYSDMTHDAACEKLQAKVPATTAEFLADFMHSDECHLLRREQEFIRAYKEAWSRAPYPPIFSTTDAVVVQSGHVLVVVRGAFPGEGLYALPGGFVDQRELLIHCAVREVMEETGILLADGKRAKEITRAMLLGSIKDKEIFDKPDRSSRGRTITTAFLMQLDDTKPLPKVRGMNAPLHETGGKKIVETRKAFWMPISDALRQTELWFEDHVHILETMIARLSQVR